MEDFNEKNNVEKARTSARRAVAKGERAAEAVADEAKTAAEDVSELGEEAAARVKTAGENAYEEFSEAVEEGKGDVAAAANSAWQAATDTARGAWESAKKEVERHPVRSAALAFAAGIIVGGIIASRD